MFNLPQAVPQLAEMVRCFNEWAVQSGLDGITFISQSTVAPTKEVSETMDYFVEYQPNYLLHNFWGNLHNMATSFRFTIHMFVRSTKTFMNRLTGIPRKPIVYSYPAAWDFILKHKPVNGKMICGAFVRCDVSPRRQERALVFIGDTPQRFQLYMQRLIKKVKKEYSTDYIFLTAWNEWGEGMYLEPDEKHKYGYLEALRNCQQPQ